MMVSDLEWISGNFFRGNEFDFLMYWTTVIVKMQFLETCHNNELNL